MFTMIDYSQIYYLQLLEKPLPLQREGKFVQIRNGVREYLVLSPKGLCVYHADIVQRFCKTQHPSLPGFTDVGSGRYYIRQKNWQVIGGGWWNIDDEQKTLRLYSVSQAYGKFDPSGLGQNIAKSPTYCDYALRIS